jgi:alpha-1,6-mannosyltransferase
MLAKSSAPARLPTLVLLGLAVGLSALFNLLGRWQGLESAVPQFIGLAFLAGVMYLVGAYVVENFHLGPAALLIILLGALIFRLAVLPREPVLSRDVYRYQWEGRVERLHLNPYTVAPSSPGLERLQDPEHPLETGRDVPTLYPPLSEFALSWVKTISGYKRLFTGLDLAAVGILLLLLAGLKQPLHRVLIYAWSPTVIVSFAMDGHHDSLAILTLLVANLCIIHRRPRFSVAFLALSAISKFFSALLLPVFLKRTRLAFAGVFAVVVAAGYLPYLGAGRRLFKGLSDYAAGWEGNDSVFRWIRLAGNSKMQAELVAGVLVLGLVAYALRKRLEPLRACLFLTAGLLLLSPNAFPWYFTWIVPFLCFYPSPSMLLMSVTCCLGYSPVVAYAAGQPYRDSPFILALEYVPVYLWLGFEGWRSLRPGPAYPPGFLDLKPPGVENA